MAQSVTLIGNLYFHAGRVAADSSQRVEVLTAAQSFEQPIFTPPRTEKVRSLGDIDKRSHRFERRNVPFVSRNFMNPTTNALISREPLDISRWWDTCNKKCALLSPEDAFLILSARWLPSGRSAPREKHSGYIANVAIVSRYAE